MIPSPNEKIPMYSPAFYAACTVGGISSCGLTHMAVTPLDLVKCNMQVNSWIFELPEFVSLFE
jgi:solute carrier family 25 phosphate transporter 3